MNDKLQTSTLIMRGPRRSERDFWKVSSSWKNFSSSQVAQLINGKNPRESWHFWPKMDLFFRKNFHDREPVENVRKKILADGKQVFFAVGDIDSSQDKWTFGPNHRKWLKNFQLSNQRPIFCLFKWWSHMGNYLTKAEKLQFRHSNSTWETKKFLIKDFNCIWFLNHFFIR